MVSQTEFYKKDINDSMRLESRLLFPISFQNKRKRVFLVVSCLFACLFVLVFLFFLFF